MIDPAKRDAAMLRLIFNEVAADQEAWRLNPMLAWEKLYVLVRDSDDGGLTVIQHMQCQADAIKRLQDEVDRLNRLIERPEVIRDVSSGKAGT